MFPKELLKRINEVKEIKDDHCQAFCKNWLGAIGIKNNRALTVNMLILFISLVLSTSMWVFTLFASEFINQTLHFLALHIMAGGLFVLHISRHEHLMDLAKKADTLFVYHDYNLKIKYKEFQAKRFSSWLKRYTRLFVILVFVVWVYIIKENLEATLFQSLDMYPPFMEPLIKNKYWALFFQINEIIYVLTAILADVMVVETFVNLNLQLCANLETLHVALESLGNIDGAVTAADQQLWLNECVRHHQLIYSAFDDINNFYSKAFLIIYFGMLSAIAFCRTLLVGENIDVASLILLLYLEMGYIHIFCMSADDVAEMCNKVNNAAYSSNWLVLPKNIRTSLTLIMSRTNKVPKIYFFMGGNDVSCETFVLIINTTTTFFIVSVLLQ